jgi:hypothetical protein
MFDFFNLKYFQIYNLFRLRNLFKFKFYSSLKSSNLREKYSSTCYWAVFGRGPRRRCSVRALFPHAPERATPRRREIPAPSRALVNPTMSSLLRSPAIRRALLAASSGRPQGVSFLRAASEAAPAFSGEGGATVRRGIGLLTVPRRYLSGQNGQPTAPPPDQVKICSRSLRDFLLDKILGIIILAFFQVLM